MKLNTECGMRNAESRLVSSGEFRVSSRNSFLATRASQLAPSSGVTLIELLIAIAIIATLSAIFLGASRSAMESARAARTKTTISKLHTLLMEHYASYMTRRVDYNITNPAALTQLDRQDLQLLAMRATMLMEMPDRWSDIIGGTVDANPPNPGATRFKERYFPPPPPSSNPFPSFTVNVPAVTQIYLRRYNNLRADTNEAIEAIKMNQSAECLYMTIMLLTGDGEARSLFSSQDIGDTDGDGAPEFLDGWGKPIQFLRWPTGFVSSLQPVDKNAITDHDPFDPFKRDIVNSGSKFTFLADAMSAYRYVPLVFSNGPDENAGINFKSEHYVASLDPYYIGTGSTDTQVGTVLYPDLAEEPYHVDNIHNHLLDNR